MAIVRTASLGLYGGPDWRRDRTMRATARMATVNSETAPTSQTGLRDEGGDGRIDIVCCQCFRSSVACHWQEKPRKNQALHILLWDGKSIESLCSNLEMSRRQRAACSKFVVAHQGDMGGSNSDRENYESASSLDLQR